MSELKNNSSNVELKRTWSHLHGAHAEKVSIKSSADDSEMSLPIKRSKLGANAVSMANKTSETQDFLIDTENKEVKDHQDDILSSDSLVQEVEEEFEDDMSDISDLSDLSGECWSSVAGTMQWIQQQMSNGNDPRILLQQLTVSNIPSDIDDLTLWRLIISMVSEPPPRKKLEHVNSLEDVIHLLKTCSRIMVLTGAGVSVSCGIPDFRSKDGIYSRLAVEYPDLPDPQAMFDIHYFQNNQGPFFKFAKEIYPGQFTPSLCHRFIKLLDDQDKLLRNYTQNIDTLEQVAGIKNVIECHGSFATATCMKCDFKTNALDIKDDIMNQVVPKCTQCVEEPGIMKPDIVFFGESLPQKFHRQMELDKDVCDLLIVIGSSLKVRPVALVPNSLPDNVPQVLINREPLHHLKFDVELLGDCDVIVNEICRRLGSEYSTVCSCSDELKEIGKDELLTPPNSPCHSPHNDINANCEIENSDYLKMNALISDEIRNKNDDMTKNTEVTNKESPPQGSNLQKEEGTDENAIKNTESPTPQGSNLQKEEGTDENAITNKESPSQPVESVTVSTPQGSNLQKEEGTNENTITNKESISMEVENDIVLTSQGSNFQKDEDADKNKLTIHENETLKSCQVKSNSDCTSINSHTLDKDSENKNNLNCHNTENESLADPHLNNTSDKDLPKDSFPKIKKSKFADLLPEKTFLFIPPCRYIFSNAEVYEGEVRDELEDDDEINEEDDHTNIIILDETTNENDCMLESNQHLKEINILHNNEQNLIENSAKKSNDADSKYVNDIDNTSKFNKTVFPPKVSLANDSASITNWINSTESHIHTNLPG